MSNVAGTGTDREHARSLDAGDPLARYRAQFAMPKGPEGKPAVYLCGNSLGLMPQSARSAVAQVLDDWASLGVRAHFEPPTPWFSYHEVFRDVGARLVGARPGEVVIMNSLTVNLHLMLTSFYRPAGRRVKILVEESMFSSDRYGVASQVQLHGLDPASTILVAPTRSEAGQQAVPTEEIEGILDERGPEIALVMLSGINYFTGQWFDIERITEGAHRQGCLVGFDLAHSAGNVPHALHDWGVDFAVWCSYKYLNSGPGAAAGCFVHERHTGNRDLPRLAGWWGHDPDTRFQMHRNLDFTAQGGAAGWQVSNPSILAMAPVKASLDMFDEVGMEALRTKSVKLTAYLEELLRRPDSDRFEILTPRDPAVRGCQLSIRVLQQPNDVFARLGQRGIVVDFREPDVIRVAPVPLYNTFEDAWVFAEEFVRAVGVHPSGTAAGA